MANSGRASSNQDLREGTVETSNSIEDPSQLFPTPGRSSRRERGVSKQRKHVTNACQRCRLDKVKCDSNTPCARCGEKNATCTYRSEEDGRSRQHVKRKIQQLEDDCRLLHNLVYTFKTADDAKVNQIISFIRRDTSLKDINTFLVQTQNGTASTRRRTGSEIENTPLIPDAAIPRYLVADSEPHQHEHSRASASNVLSIERLIDFPPYEVFAAPWTKITNDNHLVSHLISLWASWDHARPDGIVLECFLHDMKQKQLGSMYCSSFLVNSLLAAACLFSDFDDVKVCRGKPSDLMTLFIAEANHHLQQELELGNIPSVTVVQGLTILSQVMCKLDQEDQSYRYAMQATAMCEELLQARSTIMQKVATVREKGLLSYVVDCACWGVFCNISTSFFKWKQPQRLPTPSCALPESSNIIPRPHTLVWVPYLQKGQEQERHTEKIFGHFISLAMIQQDLTFLLFGNGGGNDFDTKRSSRSPFLPSLSKVEIQLHNLYDDLPQEIKKCKLRLPSVFEFLWSWHVISMTIVSVQLEKTNPDSQNSTTRQFVQVETSTEETLLKRLVDSAIEVANLARLYRFHFGYARVSSHVTQALNEAIDILLANNRDGQHDSDIIEMCTLLHAIALRFPCAASVLRSFIARAKQKCEKLPVASVKLLVDFDQEHINA